MVTDKSIVYIEKYKAQKHICVLWFIASFVNIILFILLTITDRFGDNTNDAWQWLLQQIIPILTLISGVLVNASHTNYNSKKVKRFYYALTKNLSLGYFFILTLTILSIPFAVSHSSISGYQFLKTSTTYLVPFLGLVSIVLGVFFTREDH